MISNREELLGTTYWDHNRSPILSAIIELALKDLAIADLFTAAENRSQSPLLVLAAIQSILIADPDQPLTAFIPALGGRKAFEEEEFASVLGSFVTCHFEKLKKLIQRRKEIVKTDIRRAAILRAMTASAWARLGRPNRYVLVDLGCGVGMNLMLDRLDIRLQEPGLTLMLAPDVRTSVEVLAGQVSSLDLPLAERRIGIDHQKIDANSTEDRNWLLGNVAPEDDVAMAATSAALSAFQNDPPEVLVGDAVDLLTDILTDVVPDVAVIVMHSMMIHYLPLKAQRRLDELMMDCAAQRPAAEISMEIAGKAATLACRMGAQQKLDIVGRADVDGAWVRWAGTM